MPVLKFRSIEALDQHHRDLWCDRPDAKWFERVARLWSRSQRLNPRQFPRGVHRYRNVFEADAERERWLQDHVDSLRRRRGDSD